MAFKFRWLCDLLQKLEQNRLSKASAASRTVNPDNQVLVTWFNKHHAQIPRSGEDAVAFLSCMFPERRPDRVYSLQRKRLASTFGRSLGLGTGRMKELNSWQERDGSDFPQCVEDVMAQAEFDEPSPSQEVTLQELDQALDELAARSAFSSTAIRSNADPRETYAILGTLLHRIQSWEAKWLVRMVLKNFSPVVVPEHLAMDQFHFVLRDLLDLQNSFEAAVTILGRARIRQLPPRPARDCQAALKLGIMDDLVPQIDVMVQRPPYHKARSIKHCCEMARSRQMSLERKYDGEYCQVHINLTKGNDCVKIFSKSGKDSTADRVRLHGVLKDCLGISTSEGRIKKQGILEGELLVWNHRTKTIQPFHKIRKHVQRSGRWLGNQADSPVSLDEHLMIMFYDVLLLDDDILLRQSHSKRRRRLESLIKPSPSYAEIGTQEKVNFASRNAPEQLRNAFAKAIAQRWEGLVLKGCGDPYISLNAGARCIKLKKDYISGLGDTLDFVIVGGRRDARVEQDLRLGKLSWTSFYIGCLENKVDVARFDAKPVYRIVDVLCEHNISKDDILLLNEHGKFVQVPYAVCREELEVRMDHKSVARPTELFKRPFVAEICGAGFDKPAHTSMFTLRFPRVLKIHSDRPLSETVSFAELQQLGQTSNRAPPDADSQKDREWIERLENADPKSSYIVDKSQSTSLERSPGSTATTSTSVTPSMRMKLRPPALVRADTDELSPKELSEREQTESSRLFDSRSPGREPSDGSKRRLLFTDVTPEANRSSKRVKFLEMAHTVPRQFGRTLDLDLKQREAVSSPYEGPAGRKVHAVRTSLKTTPPWCKWTGQYESSPSLPRAGASSPPPEPDDRGSPSLGIQQKPTRSLPNPREPLSEVTNISPEQRRYPSRLETGSSSDRAKERGSPLLGPASSLRKSRHEGTVGQHRSQFAMRSAAVLPTPPTSSRADVEAEALASNAKRKTTAPSSLAQRENALLIPAQNQCLKDLNSATAKIHGTPIVPGLKSTLRLVSAPHISLILASPVLLSGCLSHLHNHPTRPLEALLQQTPATFTYSTACFLNSLKTAPEGPHLVLVDIARPDAVAQEMKRLSNELEKAAFEQGRQPKKQVVFMDWNCLRWFSATPTAMSDMKEHFGGCLVWELKHESRAGRKENIGRECVKAIFNWEEAVALGVRTKEG